MKMPFLKETVLQALKKNREEHISIVREAQKGYREQAIKLLEEKLTLLKDGKAVDLRIALMLPANHIEEFDSAIRMFEATTNTHIELEDSEFRCYVEGKWQWAYQFLLSNSRYSNSASTMLEEANQSGEAGEGYARNY